MVAVKNISELLPDEPIPPPLDEEIEFNNAVREYTLFGVLVIVLVAASHVLLARYRRKDHTPTLNGGATPGTTGGGSSAASTPRLLRSPSLLTPTADDEAIVDTIAMWVCTFSLSISMGAVLLLPLSIMSNEVLAIYRDSPYVRWINRSLIQGLWNMVFLFSNLSLFVGLPFAYLFTEAEGFPGSKKGVRARMLETVVVLMLLVVLVLGVAFILALLLGYYHHHSLLHTIDVWNSFYLPFMYSLTSCLGVLFLLICTPVGLGRLFTALKSLIRGGGAELPLSPDRTARYSGSSLVEELYAVTMEEQSLARQLHSYGDNGQYHQQQQYSSTPLRKSSTTTAIKNLSSTYDMLEAPLTSYSNGSTSAATSKYRKPNRLPRPLRKSLPVGGDMEAMQNERRELYFRWQTAHAKRIHLEKMTQQGLFRRCFVYPVGVLVLVLVTGVVVVLVVFNTLKLISGFKALPLVTSVTSASTEELGVKRAVLVWILGPLGAVVEILLIMYLIAASLAGCYSLPFMQKMKPVYSDTPMVHLIGNSVLLLVLASALPLLATTLGLTNFDLLGDYGRVGWLGNFWIVLGYNVLFASATVWCLVHQFTAAVRGEIYARLGVLWRAILRKLRSSGRGDLGGSASGGGGGGGIIATVAQNTLQRALMSTSQQHVNKRE